MPKHATIRWPVLTNWFSSTLIDNDGQLMIFGNKINDAKVKIRNSEIVENTGEKLLDITFDKEN